jgi:hypothetical protein
MLALFHPRIEKEVPPAVVSRYSAESVFIDARLAPNTVGRTLPSRKTLNAFVPKSTVPVYPNQVAIAPPQAV